MRVVVAEKDHAVARSIEGLLVDAGHEVTLETSAVDLFRRVIIYGTDAAIIDIELPELNGIQLCGELRSHGYPGIIVLLTVDHDSGTVVAAFRADVDDVLAKPFDPLKLLLRVERIHSRMHGPKPSGNDALLTVGQATLSIGDLTYRVADREPQRLTPTEMRILELLMRHAGETVNRETLIDRIWGFTFEGNTNRVDVYIRRLRRKIEAVPDKPEYLHTVRGSGFRFSPPGF